MKCPECNYDNRGEDAIYCGLCYEPLKKTVKAGPQEASSTAAPDEPAKAGAGPLLQIALLVGLLSGAGVYFYGTSSQDGGRAAASLEAVRLRENTLAAENLLAVHNRGRAELLGEISKGRLDPEGFGLEGQYTKKLFQLEEEYTNGLNDLRLDCPECAVNAAYIKWSEDYRVKEAAALADFNKKYLQLVQKAGAQ